MDEPPRPTVREQLDTLFRFHLSEAPLTRKLWLWSPEDPAIVMSERDERVAIKAYIVALRRGLEFLADSIDRLEINEG